MTEGFVYGEYINIAEQLEDPRTKANIHRSDLGSFMETLFSYVIYNIIVLNNCTTYDDLMHVVCLHYPRILEYAMSKEQICQDEVADYTEEPAHCLAMFYYNRNLSQEEKMMVLDSYARYTSGMSIEEILEIGSLRITWNDIGTKVVIPWGIRQNDPWNEVTYDEFCKDLGKQLEAIGHGIIIQNQYLPIIE